MPRPFMLADRAVIAVSGEPARAFLQGLITNDMNACSPGRPVYAALLTPQGKILFDFIVFEKDGAFLLDCAAATADDFHKRLTMFRLRTKVDIARRDDLSVVAAWNGAAADPPCDPRLAALGKRDIVRDAAGNDATPAYHVHRLSLGVPDSADMPPDTVFPLDVGFEDLHGVSFRKGCYVGQEVTARMKHKGAVRRRMLIADVPGAIPPPGTPITAEGKEVGAFATGIGSRALALIRLDRLDDARMAGAAIAAAGQPVTVTKPDWLSL